MADKREYLKTLMKDYATNNNCMDISKFRKDHPGEYNLLTHYFGGINQAIEECGLVRITKAQTKTGKKVTLRNQLAYDHLVALRSTKTLEEIANMYGVTRPAINQLFIALKSAIEDGEDEDEQANI
jgi:hypothetical protein